MRWIAVAALALSVSACGFSKEEVKKALDRQKTELVKMHEESVAELQKKIDAANAELEKVKADAAAAAAAATAAKDSEVAAANAKSAKLEANIAAAKTALDAAKALLAKKDAVKATVEVDKAINALKQ